jgi:Cytochrome oxidase complex assembly protein 1
MSDARVPFNMAEIPPELDRWNWGAFLLNWIWGIGNNTFIALLTLVPGIGFIMMFVLGAKGSRWAWRNGRWDSVEHFRRVQRRWAIWGVVIYLGCAVLGAGFFGGIFSLLKNSEAYQLGAARLQGSAAAVELLGSPIATGIPYGSIKISGDAGQATLSFSASGSKASGQVSLTAEKKAGVWALQTLTLEVDGRDGVTDLLKDSKVEFDDPRRRLAAASSRERFGRVPANHERKQQI